MPAAREARPGARGCPRKSRSRPSTDRRGDAARSARAAAFDRWGAAPAAGQLPAAGVPVRGPHQQDPAGGVGEQHAGRGRGLGAAGAVSAASRAPMCSGAFRTAGSRPAGAPGWGTPSTRGTRDPVCRAARPARSRGRSGRAAPCRLLEQPLTRPVGRPPQPVAFIDGLPRTEPFGRVTPLNASPHPVQNPVDRLPVIPPPATTPVTDRQEGPQPFPLCVSRIAPPPCEPVT